LIGASRSIGAIRAREFSSTQVLFPMIVQGASPAFSAPGMPGASTPMVAPGGLPVGCDLNYIGNSTPVNFSNGAGQPVLIREAGRPDVWLLELSQVPIAKLDALSQALAGAPLKSAAFAHLLRAGFAGTTLARSMAERLVVEAMPGLMSSGHPQSMPWQDMLIHALMLRREPWALECMSLRMKLSQESGRRSPLLTWLCDALYRPLTLSEKAWHAHVAEQRKAAPGIDIQIIAKAYQDSMVEPDELEEAIENQLKELVPELERDSDRRRACMRAVRQHRNADRGIVDVRVALHKAFDLCAMDAKTIDGVYVALAKMSGGEDGASVQLTTPPPGPPVGTMRPDGTTALLIDICRDAQTAPFADSRALGSYNTFAHALVSLLLWPGGLRGLIGNIASAGVACERLVTRGESSQLRDALQGIVPAQGWMQSSMVVRRPPLVTASASSETANDADFNNPPTAPGIVLETEMPVMEIYSRAGYLVEQDERTEQFLSGQELLAAVRLPTDPLPIGRLHVPESGATEPDGHGPEWPLQRSGTSVLAEPLSAPQQAHRAIDGRQLFKEHVASHDRSYPATRAYVALAPFMDRLAEQQGLHETWQPDSLQSSKPGRSTVSTLAEHRVPVRLRQAPSHVDVQDGETTLEVVASDGAMHTEHSTEEVVDRPPSLHAKPVRQPSPALYTGPSIGGSGAGVLTAATVALARSTSHRGHVPGRKGPAIAVVSFMASLLERIGTVWGRPQALPAANPTDSTNANATAAASTFETVHDDLLILHNELRHQQRRVRTEKSLNGTIDIERVFVPVGSASPTRSYTKPVSDALRHLKLALQSGGTQNDFDGLPVISLAGVPMAIDRITRTFKVDLSKPFFVSMAYSGGIRSIRIDGQTTRGRRKHAILGDLHVKLLRGYMPIFTNAAVSHNDTKGFHKLVVRDDGEVAIVSLLKVYSVEMPAKNTEVSLGAAIEALLPKAIAASMGESEAPPEPVVMVVDTTNIPEPIKHTYDEGETSDYGVIPRRIKALADEAYSHLVMEQSGSVTPFQESAILAGLKAAGGVSFEVKVWDTDGEDDIYLKKERANPVGAKTLVEYFATMATEVGEAVVRKIRDKDGEDEGEINVQRQELTLHMPLLRQAHSLTHLDRRCIDAFDLRASSSLFVEPYSIEADKAARKVFGRITGELRIANGDVSQSPTLLAAGRRWLAAEGGTPATSPASEQAERFKQAMDNVVSAYYSYSANPIYALQRLLIDWQPTETEFLAREICRALKIDETNWPVIAGQPISFDYEVGLENAGSYLRFEDGAYKTFLELVYDEDLRSRVGLARDRDAAVDTIAKGIADKCAPPCDARKLRENLDAFFNAFSVLTLAKGVDNSGLPDGLVHPAMAFSQANDRYIEEAEESYRKLEAERIVLTSKDVLSRMDAVRELARKGSAPDGAIDCRPQLNAQERSLLDDRAKRFREYLKARRNGDNYRDLIPGWKQAALQLRDEALEICRNAPLQFCAAVNLLDDIVKGDDAKSIVLDGLFYFSGRLRQLSNVPLQRIGAWLQEGANGYLLLQSEQSYKRAIEDGRYGDADKALAGMVQSSHSVLTSGAALVERAYDRLSPGSDVALSQYPEGEDETSVSKPLAVDASSHYWTIDEGGEIVAGRIGRAVHGLLENGNLLVEGGAHAIALGHGIDAVYMLGDTPYRVIRTPLDTLELWPVRDLHLEGDRWEPAYATEDATYERAGGTAFPRTFSGPVDNGQTSRQNAAAWYDNHLSTLDSVTARTSSSAGKSAGTQTVRLGVLEHKYVVDADGMLEVVEHGGCQNERTLLIKRDGSTLSVEGLLPAWPTYKPNIEARVVGSNGLFAAVEVQKSVDGLTNKRTVSGVMIPMLVGGHRLVIELDAGIYYHGTLPSDVTPPMVPGATDETLQPFAVAMQRVPSTADPKRASPALWRSHDDYRNSAEAQADFELEIFEGAKSANDAYTRNHPWVVKHQNMIRSLQQVRPPVFPPEVSDIQSPFFKLPMTAVEDAILFAPRNRAALGRTLIGKDVEWGSVSSANDAGFIEDGLRRIQITDSADRQEGEAMHVPLRSRLFASRDRIPMEGDEQRTLHAQLKARIRGKNLVFAEVKTKEGQMAYVVTVSSNRKSDIVEAGNEIGVRHEVDGGALEMTVTPGDAKVYGIYSGAIVRQIELAYPDPSAIEAVRIFSLDAIPPGLAGDVFGASARGYPFRSVLSLEPEAGDLAGADFSLPAAPPARSSATILPAQVDLAAVTPVSDGPQAGAYRVGEAYYLKLAGETYRATWDNTHQSFRLMPAEESSSPSMDALPLVRRVAGQFQLIKGTGALTGSERSALDASALKRDLAKNPTPALLQTTKAHGTELIVVADPAKVSEAFEFDGSWVLTVEGIKYRRALAEDGRVVFVRESFEDEMTIGCGRSKRTTEPLCPAGGGLYIETKNAVTGKDLPPEGTDHPDATPRYTPWVADRRIFGTARTVSLSKNGRTRSYGLTVVPYEGSYQAIRTDKAVPVPLKPDELKALDLPESVLYKPEIDVSLVRRVRHAAHISFDRIDEHLDSKGYLGASIFKRLGTDEEWIVTQYDGQWYIGFFEHPSGTATPTSITLKQWDAAKAGRSDPDEAYEEMKRRHAGMQGANFHAKRLSWEKVSEVLEQGHQFGVSELDFDGTSYFESATTAEEAFLFDRAMRDQVQVRQRASGQWEWLRLDQASTHTRVEQSKSDMVKIMDAIFPQQNIQTIDDILRLSKNKKTPIGAKNFLIFIVNDDEVYFALSGTKLPEKSVPDIFMRTVPGADGNPVKVLDPSVEVHVNGKNMRMTFIDLDPKIGEYMDAMEASGNYPPPLPSAISPDQLAMKSDDFNLLASRDKDSERKMVAYMEFGGRVASAPPVSSISALSASNTCRSCFTLIQQYFQGKNDVVFFYGKEYDKY